MKNVTGQKPHVVLIDDDKHQAEFVRAELTLLGFSVEVVTSCAEFEKKIAKPDWAKASLFLTDLMIPYGGKRFTKSLTGNGLRTGLFMAAEIREKYPQTPIILWSTAPFAHIAVIARNFPKQLPLCRFVPKCDGVMKIKEIYERYTKTHRLGPTIMQQIGDVITDLAGDEEVLKKLAAKLLRFYIGWSG